MPAAPGASPWRQPVLTQLRAGSGFPLKDGNVAGGEKNGKKDNDVDAADESTRKKLPPKKKRENDEKEKTARGVANSENDG